MDPYDTPDQGMALIAAPFCIQPSKNRRAQALRQLHNLWSKAYASFANGGQHAATAKARCLMQVMSDLFNGGRVHHGHPHLRNRISRRQWHQRHRAFGRLHVHGHGDVHTRVARDGLGHRVAQNRHKSCRACNIDAVADASARKQPALVNILELAVAQALAGFQTRQGKERQLVEVGLQQTRRKVRGPGARGGDADSKASRQLRVGGGHERCVRLVARGDPLELRVTDHCVHHGHQGTTVAPVHVRHARLGDRVGEPLRTGDS
mmetsp:Transcript_67957/g.189830  ORF Transcript_67957/g.189830 Transcript_67957/m.189830 type:complete len:263 (-) Transcript_67957:390-1178(-)